MNRSIFFHEEYDPELSSKADHDTLRIFGLLCAICFDIPRDVVKTKHSNNLYCRNCLSQCNKDPVTRKELQIGAFKKLAKINSNKLIMYSFNVLIIKKVVFGKSDC